MYYLYFERRQSSRGYEGSWTPCITYASLYFLPMYLRIHQATFEHLHIKLALKEQ